MRYRLTLQYDGTDFHGWQIQPDRRSVQGELEAALLRLTQEPVRVAAAGRTDAGVHASGQVVSFTLDRAWDVAVLLRALNAVTPPDLSVRDAEIAGDDFDPRRQATSREYVYRIWNARWRSPFWGRYSWQVFRALDTEAMRTAAGQLLGEHDFTSFRAANCDAEHPIRRVLVSQIESRGEMVLYRVVATAFLRHMVRNIVGTLAEVGHGTRSADFAALLEQRNRDLAGATAPAAGLTLTRVRYTGAPGSEI